MHKRLPPNIKLVQRSMKAIVSILCLAMFFSACDNFSTYAKKEASTFAIASCTVECADTTKTNKTHLHRFSNGVMAEFKTGGLRTKKEAFSKDESILLTKGAKYGLNVKLNDVKLNEYFKVSIWRKDKKNLGALVIQSNNPTIFYEATTKTVENGKNGWKKIEIKFEIPPHTNQISIYAFIARSDSAYFDNLEVKRIKQKTYNEYPNNKFLSLNFSDKKMARFEKFKAEAFEQGVHFSSGVWSKGILSDGNDVLPIKARFKGDWLDHLMGKKWSFRIKVRKGKTFNRLRQFSLQTTKSRNHLHEYLSHQLMRQEGLLTTRYDFSQVYINQESRGIYAIEEHFTKQLVESNLRREGPIVKFDENPMWRNTAMHKGLNPIKDWQTYPNYQTSRIIPFGTSKIIESEKLKNQFLIAHSLLYQFKTRETPVDEIFDIDKLAKFLALTDLHQGRHGAVWHNLRFYYNPINCKLEFINYDNYTDYYKLKDFKPLALTYALDKPLSSWANLYPYLFTSKKLILQYIDYLEKYSDPIFVSDFYVKHQAKIDEFLPIIKSEFPSYKLDSSFLLNNATVIRNYLPELKERINDDFFSRIKLTDSKVLYSKNYHRVLFPYFLNAYYSKVDNKAKLHVENYNNRKVKLTRLLDNKKRPIASLKDVVIEEFKDIQGQDTIYLPYYESSAYIEFEDLDSNKKHLTELTLWNKNIKPSPYQKLLHSDSSNASQIFVEANDTLRLIGNKTLRHKVIIPSGKTVIFEAGSSVDLINEASILSFSAVHFNGSKERPILVHSSDKTGNGLSVLQAEQKSFVQHVTFSNLNTFSYEGWNLSGAINFYESKVEIQHCTFQKNSCEDALNIIKTDFLVANCKFEDIFADAFDSDYCTGKLINTSFDRVGNDAIDFSTSKIKIDSCNIQNIKDKGISGGEGSTLWVSNTQITNCNIGTASKDLSEVYLTKVSIKDSKFGLVLLQKKPEYGPALIKTEGLTFINCENDFVIEKKSKVILEGKVIEGKKKKVAEMFY